MRCLASSVANQRKSIPAPPCAAKAASGQRPSQCFNKIDSGRACYTVQGIVAEPKMLTTTILQTTAMCDHVMRNSKFHIVALVSCLAHERLRSSRNIANPDCATTALENLDSEPSPIPHLTFIHTHTHK